MARARKRTGATAEPAQDKAPRRARSRKAPVRTTLTAEEAAALPDQGLCQQLQVLEELTHQSKALMQDLRETQQRHLVLSAERASTLQDRLAECRREIAEVRQYLETLPDELRDLPRADREPAEATPKGENTSGAT